MKKLFRVIFYIPKLFYNLLGILFGLYLNPALVPAPIGYGPVYYANNSSSTLHKH